MKPRVSYFICASPRSGSYLLCDAFWQTGVTGRPEEYFWKEHGCYIRESHAPSFLPPASPELRRAVDSACAPKSDKDAAPSKAAGEYCHWGVDSFRGFLECVIAEGSTRNGVFGAKVLMSEGSHANLVERLIGLPEYVNSGLSVSDVLRLEFPGLRHIFLTRRNKVRQAISLLRARTFDRWGWQPGESSKAEEGAIKFDTAAIDRHLLEIALQEAAWDDYFSRLDVPPIVVVYEDLVRDYERTVGALLSEISGEAGDVPRRPRTTKQADHLTEELLLQYLVGKRANS